jgi:hypothetical protein
MLKLVDLLPASPGERDPDGFSLRERFRFRDNLGLGLRDVRQRAAFATLARGPWLVFITIACYWQSNAEAWPSQETIASFSGYSSRAVRDYVEVLEAAGVLCLRRERRTNGSERIYYGPGPVTLTELSAFVERFPNSPTRSASSHPQETSSGGPRNPPEVASGALPETSSREPRDQNLELSSFESVAPTAPETAEQEQPTVTQTDREIARVALADRTKRKHPKRSPPRWFDRADVEMVAICAASIEGDRESKLQALRHSVTGAFCSSRDGPPTSRFIWGKVEHFLEHLELGRRKAYAEKREAQRRAQEDAQAARQSCDRMARVGSGREWQPPPRDELAKTRAEFEALAANAAPAFRKTLESLASRYRDLERKAEGDEDPSEGPQ